ncbi:MAG TPA: 4a-hydroxytetrahydrobiopterin dehydratase [Kofleriaceae bacterium]|nr:4a-hydroxytetrahydrobiopterin dehydratase [Kofleriaceae bacterium]
MANDLDSLADRALGRTALPAGELRSALLVLGPRWSVTAEDLKLVLPVKPMARAAEVAAQAAAIADELDHHPTFVMEYPGVTLTIHSHDVKAITATDVVYAARLERWLRAKAV